MNKQIALLMICCSSIIYAMGKENPKKRKHIYITKCNEQEEPLRKRIRADDSDTVAFSQTQRWITTCNAMQQNGPMRYCN